MNEDVRSRGTSCVKSVKAIRDLLALSTFSSLLEKVGETISRFHYGRSAGAKTKLHDGLDTLLKTVFAPGRT